jgi:hypothetical protein
MNTDDEGMMSDIHQKTMRMLEEYSGPIVRLLAQSRDAMLRYINDRDPRIRFAALSLANMKWGVTLEIADLCEELTVHDVDEKVRGAAVLCLNEYYRKTGFPRIVRLLATIVLNEKEAPDVREVAYNGVVSLQEADPLKWPIGSAFRFPDDIDWALLHRSLQLPDN